MSQKAPCPKPFQGMIQGMKTQPMTDLCWICQKNNSTIYRSANVSESQKPTGTSAESCDRTLTVPRNGESCKGSGGARRWSEKVANLASMHCIHGHHHALQP